MVSRSTIAVALVVALTMLGGCSGILGDGSASSPDEFDYADGYDADGITDGEQAAETYRQALSNKSSYTVNYQQNLSGADATGNYDVVYRVDVDDERAYQRVEMPDQDYEVESFQESGQRVVREASGGNEEIATEDTGFDLANLTGVGLFSQLLSADADYETSVAERDGTSVVVYETSGNESASTVLDLGDRTPMSFSASLAVDSEGIVRSASYDLTYLNANGQEQTITLNFEVTAVDDTSVERPDWAQDA
ncbi:hypothetical protein HWV07_02185 [Natronomonas salina]|uniref:DUF7537 family lipoprotein n=1 Tax=Natronomonas salina TaxID=1710540 RepID=UPI0015B4BAC5|nr:hypothetical protein [Natronomonas salina]QLD87909.1 hypothetical protein HWV07_02185 [Natronomonas salina]